MGWKEKIGTKQDWLIVGILFLAVLVPVIGISILAYLVIEFASWATGISTVRVIVIADAILLVWAVRLELRRGER